jgi:hypothetical protein
MKETFNFTTPGNYSYNAGLIDFSAGMVKLLDLRPADATFYKNFADGNVNANWGNGDLTGTLGGGASISGGVLHIGSGVQYCDYDGVGNANSNPNEGTIRMLFASQHTGVPPDVIAYFCTAKADGERTNQKMMRLMGTGLINGWMRDKNNNNIFNSGLYAPGLIADQYYEIEMNWRSDGGNPNWWFYQDGTLRDTNNGEGAGFDTNTGLIRLGSDALKTVTGPVCIAHFIIFNTVQHTGENYTPGFGSISNTVYSLTNPVLSRTTAFGLQQLVSFVETATKPGSDEIKYQIVYEGNTYWYNGAIWTLSDGSYTQANTAIEINTAATDCCCQIGTGSAYTFNALLHSADGSTTPVLDKLEIEYEACPAPPEPTPPLPPNGEAPDYLTQSSNSRGRGPRGRMRGRPWRRYYGPKRYGNG